MIVLRWLLSLRQCERLALMARSYSEDAGLRHTLIIAPQLPIPASQSLYHKLRGVLERAFDLFLVGSEIRELPPTPDPDESTTSEVSVGSHTVMQTATGPVQGVMLVEL